MTHVKSSSHRPPSTNDDRGNGSEKVRRRQALRRYELIDNGPKESFDRITRLAADVCEVPIAAITLIGVHRQWITSPVGIERQKAGLDSSFCIHAIQSEGTMVVQNAANDERFSENSWVTGEPDIRFYAGVPLSAPNGPRIGTLCVLDTTPRTLSPEEIARLEDLAEMAMKELELHREAEKHRRAESRVRRQRNLLDQAQRLAGAWEMDLRSESASFSEKISEILEVPSGPDFGIESVIECFAPEARPQVWDAFQRCAERGKPYDLEVPVITGQGNLRWVRTVGAPAETEEGTVVKMAGALQDITDRKRQERRRKQVISRVTDAIIELDSEWRLTVVNDQAEEQLGMEEKHLLGKNFWDVFPEDRGTRFEKVYRDVMRTREPQTFEERCPVIDGWANIQVYPNREGGIAIYFEDISERKRREKALVEAKEEAERMNRLKSAFLANMSHEIRTPLTSILGFAEAIGQEVEESAEGPVSQFADLIEKGGRRLLGTLNSILTLSKLEAGEIDLSTSEIDLAAEVEATKEQFRRRAEERDIDVQAEGKRPVRTQANEGGLQIVLHNLVSNAVKYTREGGQIWLRAYQTDAAAVLEVEDTGVGMNPSRAEKLFEPFRQGSEGTSREYEGTGIGLSVTKQAVEQMGGAIEVETEKGAGTCFTVQLPPAPDPEGA